MSSLKSVVKNVVPYGIIRKYEDNRRAAQEQIFEPVPERELYNAKGERIRTFFLKDQLCAHQPWGFVYGRTPERILWDRIHPGLDIHFYTSAEALHTVGKPRKKFAYLIESDAIVPEDYRMFEEHKGLDKEFELIFTFSEKLLNQYSNARFLPASGVWYGNECSGTRWDEKQYEKKTKGISIIASDKSMCEFHKLRREIAVSLKQSGKADTFGAFDGGHRVEFIDETLTDYRFQVVIENEMTEYYFTEKIMNCFASMTIPVYIGATKIGKFFNADGIIQVKEPSCEAVFEALKQCTESFYEEHIDAIKDNFQRVKEYSCIEDYLMKHYEEELR